MDQANKALCRVLGLDTGHLARSGPKEEPDHSQRQEIFARSKQTPADFLRSLLPEKKHEIMMAQNGRSLAASSLIMLHGFQEIVVKDYEEQAGRRDSIDEDLLNSSYHHV
ncbi:hypothetical protein HO133_009060 [Letharia lupina]|uniref:Uncharacterized protein n=1 Tax=Letharia lupina TaxID=560253 RepID=A0A8H6CMY4_9LECA|nr:uncharacterized protein HO133_009060 [Letharia lupina]KAF6226194.1 hypothetical protein HO133_009060 [Letharia lupina]